MYCPKKETCHLVSLRPVRHEVRYYLVIEASINSYLHRTICVRSPLQVMQFRLSVCLASLLSFADREIYFSFEMKPRTHWDFITRKQ